MATDDETSNSPLPEPTRGKTLARVKQRAADASVLKYEKRYHAGSECAPTVYISTDMPFLPRAILGLLVWPNDPRRQAQYFMTKGLQFLDVLREGVTDELRGEMILHLADMLELPRDALVWDASLRSISDIAFSNLPYAMRRASRALEHQMVAAGGFSVASEAPGTARLMKEIRAAVLGEARNAGLLLLTVLKLNPNLYPQSLNRAAYVLFKTPVEEGGLGIDERRLKDENWEPYRVTAPLWAAIIAEIENRSAGGFQMETFYKDLIAVLNDRERLLRALSWALGIREFAKRHRSKKARSGSVLLPDHATLDLRVAGVAADEPKLRELSPSAVYYAKEPPDYWRRPPVRRKS